MRNLILYFCACIIGVVSYAQSSAYVGQTIYLNGLSYGVSGNASWYCDDGHSSCLRISGDGLYGASVYFEQYFSGTARIACQYVYYYYVGTKKQYVNGTDYYYVSCKPATTTLNKNSITLKPNETATLTGTCSSGYDLSMASWLTSDKILYILMVHRQPLAQERLLQSLQTNQENAISLVAQIQMAKTLFAM